MSKFLLLVLPVLAFGACRCHKDTAQSNNEKVVETTVSADNNTGTNQMTTDPKSLLPDTIPLVVSFYSIGEGTDIQADSVLNACLDKFQTSTGIRPADIPVRWGREGEVDHNFLLKELSDAQRKQFIDLLKADFQAHPLVHVLEHWKNRFNR